MSALLLLGEVAEIVRAVKENNKEINMTLYKFYIK